METSKALESLEERKQTLNNYLHICLYELMRLEHTIQDEIQYCETIAPIIQLVRAGALFYGEYDVDELRQKVAKATNK